ncbi:MAG: baseplate J/gp47 family protein [Kordiimonadaceae bacterium]|nr:baseplate J/gp47 family protein [Kordiimonadaceae bacterium]
MQRPSLRSQQQSAPNFREGIDGAVSLVSARATARSNRNWVVFIELAGANQPADNLGEPLIPDLTPDNFHLERLDGGANLAFIIKKIEWVQAPSSLNLHLFMAARASELDDEHLYQHMLKLISFPNQDINQAANRVPLFLLPSQPKDSNAFGMSEINPTPIIDYTAKDFDTMRQLMITNIQRVMPKWQDDTAADIGNMLLEILAYIGDYLSYRQDFAANEAYLRTAQLRTSIARHARLLGYFPQEGCTQRTILTFQVSGQLSIPAGFAVLSSHSSKQPEIVTKNSDLFNRMITGGSACYETRHQLVAMPVLNTLRIHDFGLEDYTLFAGTTAAILEFPDHLFNDNDKANDNAKKTPPLNSGSVIVFHQTAEMAAHNPGTLGTRLQAHAVRLTEIEPLDRQSQSAPGKTLVRIRWHSSDALPRDLPVTMDLGRRDDANKTVAIVYANAVEAEYGLTRTINIPRPDQIQAADWQATIAAQPLWSAPVDLTANTSVNEFLAPDPQLLTYPTLQLMEQPFIADGTPGLTHLWRPTRNLLRHGNSSRVFMLDANEDETVTLRFGKHGMGRSPSLGCQYVAHVREAVGDSGNVGTKVLTIAAPESGHFKECAQWLLDISNPMPGTAQTPSESKEAIRLRAPESIRTSNVCATLADYETFAEKFSSIKAAKAWLVDGGPWPYIQIAVIVKHATVVDSILAGEIKTYLDNHRPIGRRLIVSGPTPIPIDIAMTVVAETGYATLSLERAILAALGNSDQTKDQGFFSAGRVTFDQTIYPNDIVVAVTSVSGIKELDLTTFRRMGAPGPQVAQALSFTKGETPMLDCQANDLAGGRITIQFEKRVPA